MISFLLISSKVEYGITLGQWPCQIMKKRCRNYKHKVTIEHRLFLIARSVLKMIANDIKMKHMFLYLKHFRNNKKKTKKKRIIRISQ